MKKKIKQFKYRGNVIVQINHNNVRDDANMIRNMCESFAQNYN